MSFCIGLKLIVLLSVKVEKASYDDFYLEVAPMKSQPSSTSLEGKVFVVEGGDLSQVDDELRVTCTIALEIQQAIRNEIGLSSSCVVAKSAWQAQSINQMR